MMLGMLNRRTTAGILYDAIVIYGVLAAIRLNIVLTYNIDYEYPVIKEGPSGSFFGFSVAQHQIIVEGSKKQWLLVGAPKGNNSFLNETDSPGTVFMCNAGDTVVKCDKELNLESSGNKSEVKAGEWLGVSLKSTGAGRNIVTCAHRYAQRRQNNSDVYLGKCLILKNDTSVTTFKPCTQSHLKFDQNTERSHKQCLSGIGLDALRNSPTYVAGSVGVGSFKGRVHQLSEESNGRSVTEFDPNIQQSYSQFGYSVAVGKFLNRTRIDVAAGGPHYKYTGGVAIFNGNAKRSMSPIDPSTERDYEGLRPLLFLPNTKDQVEMGSSFGFTICAVDSDNDGYSELLVGAPFSTDNIGVPEVGQVYIYVYDRTAKMKLRTEKLIGKAVNGLFGSAITDAGDLDLDGYHDVIIGAPNENDGKGAIYLFQGSSRGLIPFSSQRIAASDVSSTLRGFGRSLAGGLDMDSSVYPDVAVGAYDSDKAVLLRTRPVVEIFASIRLRPPRISLAPHTRFLVYIFLHYKEKTGKLTRPFRIWITAEADPGRTPRFKFSRTDTNKMMTLVSIQAGLSARPASRTQAYLVHDEKGKIASYPEIKLRITYGGMPDDAKPKKTPGVVTSLDGYPILETKFEHTGARIVKRFSDLKLPIDLGCNPCIPNLSVTGETNRTIHLGSKYLAMNITIGNSGPNAAYHISLKIGLPKGVRIRNIDLGGKKRPTFDQPKQNNKRTVAELKRLFNEFVSGKKAILSVVFDIEDMDHSHMYNDIVFNITSENAEVGTYQDNMLNVSLNFISDSDLSLIGHRFTRRELYGKSVVTDSSLKYGTELRHLVKHRYNVVNKGPDLSPTSVVNIYWPYLSPSGKHLLYLVGVEAQRSNCTILEGTSTAKSNRNASRIKGNSFSQRHRRAAAADGIAVTAAPAYSTSFMPTKLPTTKQSTTSNSSTTPNITTVKPTVRSKMFNTEGKVLDCRKNTAKCKVIRCISKNVGSNQSVQITVVSRIWSKTFLEDYKNEVVSMVSYAGVSFGTNSSRIVDSDLSNNAAQLFTVLSPENIPPLQKRPSTLKLVLAVIGGVAILIIIILILYKVGFFKRKRRQYLDTTDAKSSKQALISKDEPHKSYTENL